LVNYLFGYGRAQNGGRGFGERQFLGGGLEVVPDKGGIVTIAGSVDTDTHAPVRLQEGRGL
jgi:hypothetical protein